MTKGLDKLIRLHRWRLAEKRQAVAELERLAARLRHELSEIEKRTNPAPDPTAERVAIDRADDVSPALLTRRSTLAASLMDVEDRMRGALRAVANAVREIRRYDLVKTRRERSAKERAARRRDAVMEEGESPQPRGRESV